VAFFACSVSSLGLELFRLSVAFSPFVTPANGFQSIVSFFAFSRHIRLCVRRNRSQRLHLSRTVFCVFQADKPQGAFQPAAAAVLFHPLGLHPKESKASSFRPKPSVNSSEGEFLSFVLSGFCLYVFNGEEVYFLLS